MSDGIALIVIGLLELRISWMLDEKGFHWCARFCAVFGGYAFAFGILTLFS